MSNEICTGCRDEMQRLRKELAEMTNQYLEWLGLAGKYAGEADRLERFAAPVLTEHLAGGAYNPGCEVATLEAAAIAAGLLESVPVTAPCGKDCGCLYAGSFPQNCVRLTAFGREVLKCSPA